jgi:hypothetical protein
MKIKWNQYSKRETNLYFSNPDNVRMKISRNTVDFTTILTIKFDCIISENEKNYAIALMNSINNALKEFYPNFYILSDVNIQLKESGELILTSYHIGVNDIKYYVTFDTVDHSVTKQKMIKVTIDEKIPDDEHVIEN